MKKLTAIIAMALVITITGVYAAWSYSEGAVSPATKWLDGETTTITNATDGTAKGTISVDLNTFKIVIDDTNGDYIAEMSVSGEIKIKFTPNPGASDTEILLQFCLQANPNGAPKYDGNDIFTFNTEQHKVNGDAKVGTTEITLTAQQIIDATGLALNGDISLPTKSAYDTFKAALHSGSIGIVVSERTA